MKTKILHIAILLIAPLFWACDDYLDKDAPDEDLTLEKVFSNRDMANEFLTNLYSHQPFEANFGERRGIYRSPWAGGSDEMEVSYGNSYSNDINTGAWNASDIGIEMPIWDNGFEAIRKCCIFIQRVDNVPTSDAEKKHWKGEAHFLRAFYHYLILRAFGPIPIMKEPYISSTDNNTVYRTPMQECIDFIADDCDMAASLLPAKQDVWNYCRATAAGAKGLKSRVLLYMASPLYNGNEDYKTVTDQRGERLFPDYDKARWQRAADAGLDCITYCLQNGYDLYKDPNNNPVLNFQGVLSEYYNVEWLHYRNVGDWQHANVCNDPVGLGGYSFFNPTQELVDAYLMADGSTPITGYNANGSPVVNAASGYVEEGYVASASTDPNRWPAGVRNMYVNREPRFYASINFPGQIYKENIDGTPHVLEFWKSGVDGRGTGSSFSKTGYIMRRQADPKFLGNPWRARAQSWLWIRLGEIYLNYAEALNEAQGPVTDVHKYVNLIRDRVGLPDVPDNLTQDQMRDVIKRERRVELAFENHRYFDVRRWKDAPKYDNRTFYGLNIDFGTHMQDDEFYKRVVMEHRVFESPKHYLWPIPQQEINKSRSLIQNPGWAGSSD